MKILVVGDQHAKAGISNRRFNWLGNFIVDHQPEVIVLMGDLFDMESLSSYDMGKKSFEGRRYTNDIAAGNNALELIEAPIARYNRSRKDKKIAQYRPRRIALMGNHEERILRALNMQPNLEGAIGYGSFHFDQHGWETHAYMEPVLIEDIAFSHCIGGGIENRPISGERHALSLLQRKYCSAVVAHVHTRDFAERTSETGRKLVAVVAGCYLDPDQREAYAGSANNLWWKGLVMLEDVKNGYYDPHFYGIEKIQAQYS